MLHNRCSLCNWPPSLQLQAVRSHLSIKLQNTHVITIMIRLAALCQRRALIYILIRPSPGIGLIAGRLLLCAFDANETDSPGSGVYLKLVVWRRFIAECFLENSRTYGELVRFCFMKRFDMRHTLNFVGSNLVVPQLYRSVALAIQDFLSVSEHHVY